MLGNLAQFKDYKRRWLSEDAVVCVTVAAVTNPRIQLEGYHVDVRKEHVHKIIDSIIAVIKKERA